jgi:hypothetical protein
MQRRPLAEIAAEPWVAGPLVAILERHLAAVEVVRRAARLVGSVVVVDLADSGIESSNKFIAYDLFPEAAYTVVVSRDAKRAKVSVGSNPWARPPRPHDISKLCERYGGGGHAVVGAVSLSPDRLEDARRIAREITAALQGEPGGPAGAAGPSPARAEGAARPPARTSSSSTTTTTSARRSRRCSPRPGTRCSRRRTARSRSSA